MIKKATVIGSGLEITEHGFLTHWLSLDYGDGTKQNFGGYNLGGGSFNAKDHKVVPGYFTSWYLANIAKVCGVDAAENCIGATVLVDTVGDWPNKIIQIGNPDKDIWFNPNDYLKK